MAIVIPPRKGGPATTPATSADGSKPKIVIPPRGTKATGPTEKKVPILPGRVGAPAVVKQREAVDSAAFNRSVLPIFGKEKTEPNLPPPRVIMPKPEAKLTGIDLDLEDLLRQFPLPLTPMGDPFNLYEWQKEDITTLVQWDRVGMYLPVGAGKTVISTLVNLAWTLHNGVEYKVVILPPILIGQWVKWINAIGNSGGAVAYKGVPKKRMQIDLLASKWWIMSYVIFKSDYDHLLKLLQRKRYSLTVDEAQNIKNTESQLHKLSARFSAGQSLCLMTGTELNKPDDAYAYVKIKTPGVYRSYGQFMNIHSKETDFFGNTIEWQNLDLMHDNLYLQSVHRTKEEVHAHLPRAKYMPLEYELDSKHMKLYKELGEQQMLELDDGGKVDATTQQTLWNHMQQIVLNPANYGMTDIRPAAFDVIDSLIDQLGFGSAKGPKKFIIWTWYTQSTELVAAYLESLYPGRVAKAYGKSNSSKEFDRFLEDPECWWVVAQPLSAGAGVNPQYVCYNCLFLETPTRTIPFRQAAGRLDREGQRESANIWIGIAKGTIQETLYQNLLTNDALVQQVQKNPRDIRKMIYGGGE